MLLFVDSCISYRGDRSRSHALCEAFLDTYKKEHPGEEIEVVDLQHLGQRPFDQFASDDLNALRKVKSFDSPVFKLARQFQRADRIVVGAPLRDLTFPAMLHIYIEHVDIREVTYHYEGDHTVGDCKADKLAYLVVSGGNEEENNLGVEYWRQLCERFGIENFYNIGAYGLDMDPAKTQEILDSACDKARELAKMF